MQLTNQPPSTYLARRNPGNCRPMMNQFPQDVSQPPSASKTSDNILLRLPAELRNRIYDQVLGGKVYRFKSTIACRHARLDTKEPHVLALLYVCRAIYSETALLPYVLNTFSFRDLAISLYPFLRQRSPAQFSCIRSLELVTSKGVRMWAESSAFSSGLAQEMRVLEQLPSLVYLNVLIDTVASLYHDASGPDLPDFNISWHNMHLLDCDIRIRLPDIILTFQFVQDLGIGAK